MAFEGWKPGSRSYRNRNPGNIESAPGVYGIYATFVEGYQALLDDLKGKFTGRNRHGLGPQSTVTQLMNVYAPPSENPTQEYILFIISRVTLALGRSIGQSTKLGDIWTEPQAVSS